MGAGRNRRRPHRRLWVGMQTQNVDLPAPEAVFQFIAVHWIWALIAGIALGLEIWWRWKQSPKDLTGNGIVIGQAKAFDSSSLTLRLQRLNAGLEALKIVNQNLTDNLSIVQERSSTDSIASLSLISKEGERKDAGSKNKPADKKASGDDAKGALTSDIKSSVGLGAGDALANQLNLASQIFNLQTLYEGSLSDRMTSRGSRLQTVLGFQVSISPPAGT